MTQRELNFHPLSLSWDGAAPEGFVLVYVFRVESSCDYSDTKENLIVTGFLEAVLEVCVFDFYVLFRLDGKGDAVSAACL